MKDENGQRTVRFVFVDGHHWMHCKAVAVVRGNSVTVGSSGMVPIVKGALERRYNFELWDLDVTPRSQGPRAVNLHASTDQSRGV